MARYENTEWELPDRNTNWEHASIAILMDIRGELQSIRRLIDPEHRKTERDRKKTEEQVQIERMRAKECRTIIKGKILGVIGTFPKRCHANALIRTLCYRIAGYDFDIDKTKQWDPKTWDRWEELDMKSALMIRDAIKKATAPLPSEPSGL